MKKSLKVDWPGVAIILASIIAIIVAILDFVFLQNPDLGFQIFSLSGFATFVERFILNIFTPVGLIGLVALIIGGVGVTKARLDLRKAGMTITGSAKLEAVEDHKLLTEGIYKHIRHPMYLAALFQRSGIAMIFTSVIGGFFVPLIMVIMLFRIPIEEKMLVEAFGEEYKEYQKRTKKLIPFLY
ncbi:MAG: methyltransferase family protein [Candidatus Thorarchaeota archaeon]|jgi:protein-S-isoprenylcysteine O-methyltransferase Ste14